MTATAYKMIAIDLDGTLLGDDETVSAENLAALRRAAAGGVMVVPCTGRAWLESKRVLDQLPAPGPGVFVNGAVVADLPSGDSLDLAIIEPHLAAAIVEHLYDMPEAVLVLQDAQQVGHDYLITGRGELAPKTQAWFDACGSAVRYTERPSLEQLHHTLRVAMLADERRMRKVADDVLAAFPGRLSTHYFGALQRPDDPQSRSLFEMFAAGVDKWRGLMWLGGQHGIHPRQIAAIGDEINDLSMIQNAGCGVAMDNAIDDAKSIADRTTLSNTQHGVAHAIDMLIEGQWP